MKVAQKIELAINLMPAGTTFRYRELGIMPAQYAAAAKALERLIKKEVISRASTGVFYKPKRTAFGILKPGEDELLKPYLFENNKRVAYITGTALYNRLGLTTQIPKNIRVASRSKRIETRVGNIGVKPAKSYVEITEENYYLAELLDVLKDFKKIPDIDINQAIRFMLQKLRDLSTADRTVFTKLALKYPPRVRAFVGALLEQIDPKSPPKSLQKSINPLTIFGLGISPQLLPTVENWNIK